MISHANDFRSLRNLIRPVVGRAPAARSGRAPAARSGHPKCSRAAAVGPGIQIRLTISWSLMPTTLAACEISFALSLAAPQPPVAGTELLLLAQAFVGSAAAAAPVVAPQVLQALEGLMFSFLVGCMCIEFRLYIWIYEKTHLKTQLYTMVNVTHYISFYLIMMLKAVSD